MAVTFQEQERLISRPKIEKSLQKHNARYIFNSIMKVLVPQVECDVYTNQLLGTDSTIIMMSRAL